MSTLREFADHRLLALTDEAHRLARARLESKRDAPLPNVGRIVRHLGVPGGKLHGEDKELCEEHCRQNGIALNQSAPTVPLEAFFATRTLTAGSSAIVGTTDAVDEVVAAFRNRSVVGAFGAQLLTGITGNAAMPTIATGATVTWHSSETAAATPTDQTLGSIALAPKKVSASTELSKMLALQSHCEAIVRNDLANAIVAAVDTAAVAGAVNGPTGVLSHSNINTVSGTSLAWGGLLDFIVNAGTQHLDVTGFATTPAVYKLLANRARLASGSIPIIDDGSIDGRPVRHSVAIPSATLVGGPWDQVVIAIWAGVELRTDPFTKFTSDVVAVRATMFLDVGVKNGAAFTKSTSVT